MTVTLIKRRIERHKRQAENAKAAGRDKEYREERKAMLLAQAELYQARRKK